MRQDSLQPKQLLLRLVYDHRIQLFLKFLLWFSTGLPSPTYKLKIFKDITPGVDAKVVPSVDVAEDTTTLLVSEANVSPFKSLVSIPSEPIGAPSLYFFPGIGQHIMSNLTATTELTWSG